MGFNKPGGGATVNFTLPLGHPPAAEIESESPAK
jgi:hypothetical protein